jgi:hypothetical protein
MRKKAAETTRKEQHVSSEVAQLMERLQLEADAVFQGLYGYAEIARHQVIHHHVQRVGATFQQLKQHVDEHEAARLLTSAMDEAERKGNEGKPSLLEIRRRTTITTQALAERAELPIADVFTVEIGGFSSSEKVHKVVTAFNQLSGMHIAREDIRICRCRNIV